MSGIFVSRRNVKECNTRLPTFGCHMHQTFSQRSVGVTSEAETKSYVDKVSFNQGLVQTARFFFTFPHLGGATRVAPPTPNSIGL